MNRVRLNTRVAIQRSDDDDDDDDDNNYGDKEPVLKPDRGHATAFV